jgi:hypothetical protein
VRRKTIVLLAVGALGLAGCSDTTAITFPALLPGGAIASQGPQAVISAADTAAARRGSVHIQSTSGRGAQETVSSYDVTGNEGSQTISGAGGRAEIRVVGGTAYQRADAAYLEQSEGFPAQAAAAYAGRWISFRPGQTGFDVVSASDTLSSAIAEVLPAGPLHTVAATTVAGQPVFGVAGRVPAAAGGGGREILYVSVYAPHLPVEAVQQFDTSAGAESDTLVFSHWGERVAVSSPTRAVPITSLIPPGS